MRRAWPRRDVALRGRGPTGWQAAVTSARKKKQAYPAGSSRAGTSTTRVIDALRTSPSTLGSGAGAPGTPRSNRPIPSALTRWASSSGAAIAGFASAQTSPSTR